MGPCRCQDILSAADRVQASYAGNLPDAICRYLGSDIQAVQTRDGTLFIPGTDSRADWVKFNLPTSRVAGRTYNVFAASPAGPVLWYYGFLRFAAWLAHAIGTKTPDNIVGHSLGGAVAQILAIHYGVPALTFGAPKVTVSPDRIAGEEMILNLCHPEDTVTKFPFDGHARHLGQVFVISPGGAKGLVHRLPLYKKYVRPDIAAAKVGATWPVGARSVRQNI